MVPEWNQNFEKALEKDNGRGKLSVLPVMINSFGLSYSFSSILMLVVSVLQFANPQIVNLLIDFVESDDPNWKGYIFPYTFDFGYSPTVYLGISTPCSSLW